MYDVLFLFDSECFCFFYLLVVKPLWKRLNVHAVLESVFSDACTNQPCQVAA